MNFEFLDKLKFTTNIYEGVKLKDSSLGDPFAELSLKPNNPKPKTIGFGQ